MIHEAIISTRNADGSTHVTPLGYTREGEQVLLRPFIPSRTEQNLRRHPEAVINLCDDVRIFAGALTGHRDWPLEASGSVGVERLAGALATLELGITHIEDDPQRPTFHCDIRESHNLAPFQGFNRAQAAVVEGAILVSRLNMLSPDKIDHELEYLRIAIDKTAGARELEAWGWLMERIRDFRNTDATEVDGA